MRDEGYVRIDSRRFGPLAALRRKQWWSFEGLDPRRKLYFVFLALQAFPSDYVSMKVIDYDSGRRWTEDRLGKFRAAPGEAVDVAAQGRWGRLAFHGRLEDGWQVEVRTPSLDGRLTQQARSPVHRDRLLTRSLDYAIQQFASVRTEGRLRFEGQDLPFAGYGYAEHAWGVQPRHSTAYWLHFWGRDLAAVVLSCTYDYGVAHHYTYLWRGGEDFRLGSPAHFTYDPAFPQSPWRVRSADLELDVRPLVVHHTRMRIPPWPAYIDIDYHEQLAEVSGTAWVRGKRVPIRAIGKMDHNWNRW
jgi:hypothetical protein